MRRLCKVRVVGLTGAVDLFELCAAECSAEWQTRRDSYESALALYEAGKWAECCKTLYPLLAGAEGHYDVPSLNLARRALECLTSPPKVFDPVVDISSK
jgi:adenylate cyclase